MDMHPWQDPTPSSASMDLDIPICTEPTNPPIVEDTTSANVCYVEKPPDMVFVDGLPSDVNFDKMQHLDTKQKELLKDLLRRNKDVFAQDYTKPSQAKGAEMHIHLETNAVPRYVPARMVNPEARLLIINHVQNLLRDGIIEPAMSPWNSPVILLTKADNSILFACDFRYINSQTKPLFSSLALAGDCMDALGFKDFYTSIDCASAYWSVSLAESSRDYTAFQPAPGFPQYRWTRAAFGLKTSGQHFVNLMQKVTAGLNWVNCLSYSDDVVIFTRGSFERHLEEADKVLKRLIEFGIKIKGKKSEWAVKEFSFLGQIVSAEGVRVDPKKLTAIRSIPLPTTSKQLKSFLGAVGAWRRYIPAFAEIADPLRPLLAQFTTLNDEQIAAIDKLKDIVCSGRVMHHPRWDLAFEIHCDASKRGLGAVLLQRIDGELRPIRFFSRATTKVEKDYAANELEVLSALIACETFRGYVCMSPFTLVTDHSALKQLFESKCNPKGGRQTRWLLRLSEFQMNIRHKSGRTHVTPDFLSRHPDPTVDPEEGPEVESLKAYDMKENDETPVRVATKRGAFTTQQQKVQKESREERAARRSGDNKSTVPVSENKTEDNNPLTNPLSIDCPAPSQHTAAGIKTTVPPPSGDSGNMNQPILDQCDLIAPLREPQTEPVDEKTREFADNPRIGDETILQLPKKTPRSIIPHPDSVEATLEKLDTTIDLRARILQAQQEDETVKNKYQRLRTKTCACNTTNLDDEHHLDSCWRRQYMYVAKDDGILYARRRIHRTESTFVDDRFVVPKALQLPVLHHFHSIAHQGKNRVLEQMGRRFWWQHMTQDVRRWTRACLTCAMRKTPQPQKAGLQGTLAAEYPNQYCFIDVLGPFPLSASGNKYIVTQICPFVRWPEAQPIPDLTVDNLARAIMDGWISRHGVMKYLVADNGIKGKVLDELFQILGLRRLKVPPYLPTRLAPVERFHRYLNTSLSMFTNKYKQNWDEILPTMLFAYRTTCHESSKVSPFVALFGRQPRLPIDLALDLGDPDINVAATNSEYLQTTRSALRDIWRGIREEQEKQVARNKRRTDLTHYEIIFQPGDFVLVYDPPAAEKLPHTIFAKRKLMDSWTGPFKVKKAHGKMSQLISFFNPSRNRDETAHVNRVVRYHPFDNELPSVSHRERISAAERKQMNAQGSSAPIPLKHPELGDLIVFPRMMLDPANDIESPGFGVGKIISLDKNDSINAQWYGNYSDTLLGTYRPCWSAPGSATFEYGDRTRGMQEYTTDDTNTMVKSSDLADIGFNLSAQHRLPRLTLERIQAHPSFAWRFEA